jgi:hypothetical protein
MLATCSNILQLWNNQNYSLVNEFGHDHSPSTDTIKSIDWKKDNCILFFIFFNEILFCFLSKLSCIYI